MRKDVAYIITGIFIAAIVGGFLVLKNATSGGSDLSTITLNSATSSASTPSSASLQIPDGYKKYTDQQRGFSFYYPADIPPKEYSDHPPEFTVAFQNEDGGAGFQIYAAPIDGNQITKERFVRDEPSGAQKDLQHTNVDGSQAIAF